MRPTVRMPHFLMLLLVLFNLAGYAQDTANTLAHVSIASPTAASLGKYGDVPVSYNTGIPQIGIPVYTVQSGSLKLPVSLSYHASGIKVQETSGWVGTGWTLNAGGVITRTVMGSPDDKGLSTNLTTNGHYTDYGFNSYLTTAASPGSPDDIAFARGYKDGEPDLYFFNFNGISGKFYFNDDRTPMVVPESDFDIKPFYATGSGFQGFIITTADGTKYFFGQTGNNGPVNPIETTIPVTYALGAASTNAAASSWFLNKIISADGVDSITLSYASESYSYYTLSLSPILMSEYHANIYQKNGIDVVKNLVNGVRLSRINFPNGHINFTPSPSARTDLSDYSGVNLTDGTNTSAFSLGSIAIYDNNGFCKKDSLYYSYWQDGNSLNNFLSNNFSGYNLHSDAYRLRLDSVQEMTCDNTIKVPPYKFNYASGNLPRRLSFGADHWGFANGADTNKVMVPTYTVVTQGAGATFPGANRDAAWPAMQAGALTQITYPTGGSSSFQYEPKGSYTIPSAVYTDMALAGFAVHYYGQSAVTQTMSFTTVGDGAVTVHITNMSTNYSPTLVIKNSSNVVVYNSYYINYATTDAFGTVTGTVFNASVNLPVGTYTATLSYDAPNPNSVINGAYGTVGQWQYYPTTFTMLVGGLRIKSVAVNDGMTPNDLVTSYSYGGTQYNSGGTLYSIPVYLQIIRNDLKKLVTPSSCSPNGCQSCDGFNAHDYFVSPGSIQPMATMQGEHMGYTQVEVRRNGQGRTVYQFYASNKFTPSPIDVCVRSLTQSSLCDPAIPNYPFPPLPFEFMRGELQSEGYYREDGTFIKGTNYYPSYTLDPLTTPGLISVDKPGLFSHTEYRLQNAYKTQDKSVTTTYDNQGNSVTSTTTTYYGSPFHHSPTRVVTSTSTGDSLAINTKYAYDFRISSCDAIPDSIAYYNNLIYNDSLQMLTALTTCSPQTNDATNCRLFVYAAYRDTVAQHRIRLINYRKRNFLDPTSTRSNCYLSALGSADANLKPILRLQNEYYNAPVETTQWKNLNLRHASFTKYDTSASPIGYVYPGKTRLISLQVPSASFTQSVIAGNTISLDARYLDEASYKFASGNAIEVTGHDGISNAYVWDYANKRTIAKVLNATADQVSYTSFEADGSGGWTIASPTRDAANAITGRQSYSLSNGACSRSGLSTSSKYIVSYWSKTGTSYTVTGSAAIKQGKTINGWTYFEHTLTGASSVSVTGTGGIDELRLYPYNAQMTTYTYSPIVGITTECDVDSRCSYYTYDGLGRLRWIKDQDGNIIKTLEYHYKGQ